MNIKTTIRTILMALALVTAAFGQSVISAGKAIKIEISGVPVEEKSQFAVTFPVSEGGTINLPHIGTMRAAGVRSDQLAKVIEGAYKSRGIYTNPTVQVINSSETSIVEEMVHVGGYVSHPGPVKYTRGLTLYQAVQAAGGPNTFGNMKKVKLYRGGKLLEFDLTKGQFMTVPVETNDTIEVPQKPALPFLGG